MSKLTRRQFIERRGFSLFEMLTSLVILAALAGIVLPQLGGVTGSARATVTNANLQLLREAIMDSYWGDMEGYPHPSAAAIAGGRADHPQLRYLFVNPNTEDETIDYDPVTRLGWRGIYVQHSHGSYQVIAGNGFTAVYGENDDPAIVDGWNNPIVIQKPTVTTKILPVEIEAEQLLYTRLVSAGPDGVIDTPATKLFPGDGTNPLDLTGADRGDDFVLFLRVADVE